MAKKKYAGKKKHSAPKVKPGQPWIARLAAKKERSSDDGLKPLLAILPGPVIAWANAWIEPFGQTIFAPPGSHRLAATSAAAITTVLVIIVWFACHRWRAGRLRVWTAICFGVCIFSFAGAAAIRNYLRSPLPQQTVEAWQDAWMEIYIVGVTGAVTAIPFAILAYQNRSLKKAS